MTSLRGKKSGIIAGVGRPRRAMFHVSDCTLGPWRTTFPLESPPSPECVLMSQELSAEQIQQALQGISVPPQPQIMVDLQMEQYMPDPDLEVIARLISQDPGLSGALLKIVNSPYYGLSNKIASIQRAVNLLGSRSIINLINAQSIKGEMADETIVTLNRFWDTAQDVAMTSLTLAKRTGGQAVDESYALGLFHDCGIPLMIKRFPNYMSVLERAYANAGPEQRVVDTEKAELNTTMRWSATTRPNPGACRSM